MEEKLLTAAEVAAKLDVSKRYVLKLCASGQLPSKMLGVQYFVKESDLAEFERAEVGRPKKDTIELKVEKSKLSAKDLKLIEDLKKRYDK